MIAPALVRWPKTSCGRLTRSALRSHNVSIRLAFGVSTPSTSRHGFVKIDNGEIFFDCEPNNNNKEAKAHNFIENFAAEICGALLERRMVGKQTLLWLKIRQQQSKYFASDFYQIEMTEFWFRGRLLAF